MKTKLLLLILTISLQSFAQNKNELWMHDSTLGIKVNSSWRIIGHQPFGSRSAVAFQLFNNPAENGTPDSTNLSITTYGLSDIQNVLEFNKAVLSKPQEGETDSDFEGWVIRSWSGDQDETKYKIMDARTTNKATKLGIHIRLAWPILKETPDNYDKSMETTLKELISQINNKYPEPK